MGLEPGLSQRDCFAAFLQFVLNEQNLQVDVSLPKLLEGAWHEARLTFSACDRPRASVYWPSTTRFTKYLCMARDF